MIDLAAANHTGKELDLMLAGRKPLAMFYAELSELPEEELIPEDAFASHVAANHFVREEVIVDGPFSEKLRRETRIKYVYFALPNETWRIRAMILVNESFDQASCYWNEALERST
jgi:hypothetical protein